MNLVGSHLFVKQAIRSAAVSFVAVAVFGPVASLAAQTARVVSPPAIAPTMPSGDNDLDVVPPPRDFALAPDGQALAFVRVWSKRGQIDAFGDATETPEGFAEPTTLWYAAAPDWHARKLLGPADGPGQLSQLHWSPDGQRLAIVSTRGAHSRVLIWDRHSRHVVASSPCVITDENDEAVHDRIVVRFHWITGRRAVLLGQPCDDPIDVNHDFVYGALQGAFDASLGWSVRNHGHRPAVSVLHGGVPTDSMPIETRRLWVVDAINGSSRIVANGPFERFATPPTADAVTLYEAFGAPPPSAAEKAGFTALSLVYRLAVVSLRVGGSLTEVPSSAPVIRGSARWSPDGTRLGFVEYDWPNFGVPCAVVYDRASRTRVPGVCGQIGSALPGSVRDPSSDPPATHAIAWLGDGRMAVRLCGPAASNSDTPRCDWRALDSAGAPENNLTESLRIVPDSLWGVAGRTFGMSGRQLLEIGRATGGSRNGQLAVPASLSDSVGSVVAVRSGTGASPTIIVRDPASRQWTAVSPDSETSHVVFALSWADRACERTEKGAPETYVSSDSAWRAVVVSIRDSLTTTWSVIARGTGQHRFSCHTLAVTKQAGARPLARERVISYRSERGDSLTAAVTLPLGYVPGRQYPVVVIVYPGLSPPQFTGERLTSNYSWAAYGYAELIPTQPIAADSEPVISQVTAGVLPAVDTLIRLGIADSAHIGVVGASFGGYTVYALLTQTGRFKAAIAQAGYANEFSRWGVFMPYNRYNGTAAFERAPYWYVEGAQSDLRSTPWARPDLYVKNSPFFMVDRIHTPVMIIQGDQDFVPMIQGEQMFNALRRLGTRVDFVRYWGEGHGLDGYWDELDCEARERAWFAHYLGGSTQPSDRTHPGNPTC